MAEYAHDPSVEDPFGHRAGPFEIKEVPRAEGGVTRWFRCKIEDHHTNGGGRAHGGLTMTIADEALGAAAWEAIEDNPAFTVSLKVDFVGAVKVGEWLEAAADEVSVTKSLVFVHGRLYADGRVIAHASGVWKRVDSTHFAHFDPAGKRD